MAGQWTMSSQNWALTGQILGFPDMLSGHLLVPKKFLKEILTLNYLIVTGDKIHVSERKTKTNVLHKPKQFYLLVEKFPVVANFH